MVLTQLDLSNMTGGLQDMQLRDYLEILRRRKLWILFVSVSLLVMGLVVAERLPNTYHAQTVIVVDPGQVPDNIVPTTVTTSVIDRLSTIRQLVYSPTRLSALIQRLNLFSDWKGRRDMDLMIAAMQKSITIEVADSGSSRLGAFKIGYTSRKPSETAQVANELAAMVIQESLKAREKQMSGTQDFLETELQDTKRQLEQKEAEVSRIKTQFIMDLPESKQFHLEALDSLRGQLRNSQDRINRDQQEKVYLQSLAVNSHPVIDVDAGNTGTTGTQTQAQIQKMETSLAELRARYGPNYPDVRKVQSQLEALKAKEAQEEANAPKQEVSIQAASKAAKNPVIDSQLSKLDQEIAEQTKLQAQLTEQINFHVSKLEQEPVFESRIAGLMRDYDSLRLHYNQLLERKLAAEMASNLEDHQKGERFQTLDAATVPDKPAGPNRPLIAVGALLGGLFAGLGVALVIDFTDTSVRSEREAAKMLGAPVLAGIPIIASSRSQWSQKVRLMLGLAGAIACSAAVGFLITAVTN
jgi:polysaccharide chain length determinant protein (PEP-CTERM system associated)